MPISSLIIHAAIGHADAVAQAIQIRPGVTVAETQGERLVVLTETANRDEDRHIWNELENTEHVVGVNLIYHNFEDLEEE